MYSNNLFVQRLVSFREVQRSENQKEIFFEKILSLLGEFSDSSISSYSIDFGEAIIFALNEDNFQLKKLAIQLFACLLRWRPIYGQHLHNQVCQVIKKTMDFNQSKFDQCVKAVSALLSNEHLIELLNFCENILKQKQSNNVQNHYFQLLHERLEWERASINQEKVSSHSQLNNIFNLTATRDLFKPFNNVMCTENWLKVTSKIIQLAQQAHSKEGQQFLETIQKKIIKMFDQTLVAKIFNKSCFKNQSYIWLKQTIQAFDEKINLRIFQFINKQLLSSDILSQPFAEMIEVFISSIQKFNISSEEKNQFFMKVQEKLFRSLSRLDNEHIKENVSAKWKVINMLALIFNKVHVNQTKKMLEICPRSVPQTKLLYYSTILIYEEESLHKFVINSSPHLKEFQKLFDTYVDWAINQQQDLFKKDDSIRATFGHFLLVVKIVAKYTPKLLLEIQRLTGVLKLIFNQSFYGILEDLCYDTFEALMNCCDPNINEVVRSKIEKLYEQLFTKISSYEINTNERPKWSYIIKIIGRYFKISEDNSRLQNYKIFWKAIFNILQILSNTSCLNLKLIEESYELLCILAMREQFGQLQNHLGAVYSHLEKYPNSSIVRFIDEVAVRTSNQITSEIILQKNQFVEMAISSNFIQYTTSLLYQSTIFILQNKHSTDQLIDQSIIGQLWNQLRNKFFQMSKFNQSQRILSVIKVLTFQFIFSSENQSQKVKMFIVTINDLFKLIKKTNESLNKQNTFDETSLKHLTLKCLLMEFSNEFLQIYGIKSANLRGTIEMRVYYENISELFYEDEKKSKDLNAKSMEGSNFNLLNLESHLHLCVLRGGALMLGDMAQVAVESIQNHLYSHMFTICELIQSLTEKRSFNSERIVASQLKSLKERSMLAKGRLNEILFG